MIKHYPTELIPVLDTRLTFRTRDLRTQAAADRYTEKLFHVKAKLREGGRTRRR
jgi:hypothetical protein